MVVAVPPSSNAPAPGSPRPSARPELQSLVRQLAALPANVRNEVVSAAEEAATAKPVLSWAEIDRARGVVALGGNAVDDANSLYDGA